MYWTTEHGTEEQAKKEQPATYHPNHENCHSIGLLIFDELPLQPPYSVLFHGRWGGEKHIIQ